MTKACELDSHGLYGNTPKALIGHTGRTMIGNRTSTHHTTVDDTNVVLESKQKLQYFVFKCSKFTQTLQKTVCESLKKKQPIMLMANNAERINTNIAINGQGLETGVRLQTVHI